ncbi:MAG: hypothetical protein ACRD0Z_17540 [Acidimicrobiales bacterium]
MPGALPAAFAEMFDDAAMFPPGSAPLQQAASGHRRHIGAWYGRLVGPLVCSASRLEDLRAELAGSGPVDVSVVAPCDWALLEPLFEQLAASCAGRGTEARVVALEVSVGTEAGAAERARLLAKMLAAARVMASSVQKPSLFVEVPPGSERLAALDVVAEAAGRSFMTARVAAKLRTGGLAPQAFPPDQDVAAFLVACAERSLAFKCTAGLHSVTRYFETSTGYQHQGFGNLLLAAGASLHGAPVEELARIVGERDESVVAAGIRSAERSWVAGARSRFLSFGTCSVSEPVEDLIRLGLLVPPSGQSSVGAPPAGLAAEGDA